MITREELENIALLSKLYVAEEEVEKLTQDLQQMMEFADCVAKADVGNMNISDTSEHTPLREDEVKESLPRSDVFLNTNAPCIGYFTVEKNG